MEGLLDLEQPAKSSRFSPVKKAKGKSFKPKKVVVENGQMKYYDAAKSGKVQSKPKKTFMLSDCIVTQTEEQIASNSFKVTVKGAKSKKGEEMVFKCKNKEDVEQWVHDTKIQTGQVKPSSAVVDTSTPEEVPTASSAPAPAGPIVRTVAHGHSRRPSLEVENIKVVVVEHPNKKQAHSFKPTTGITKKRRNSLDRAPINVVKHEHDGKQAVVTMHKDKFWFCVPCV